LTQNEAKLSKTLKITMSFEENANYLAQNCRKSQKIVIIASTPGGSAAHLESLAAEIIPSNRDYSASEKKLGPPKKRRFISFMVAGRRPVKREKLEKNAPPETLESSSTAGEHSLSLNSLN
jgi:hypothetical protein